MIKKILRIQSSTLMLVAMFAGFVVGLFFGESVGWLSVIGNSSILLMQMTVLPFIVVSLVGGIGKLKKTTASIIFSRAGIIMLLLWLLGLALVMLMPLSFPFVESASFFSTSIIEPSASKPAPAAIAAVTSSAAITITITIMIMTAMAQGAVSNP